MAGISAIVGDGQAAAQTAAAKPAATKLESSESRRKARMTPRRCRNRPWHAGLKLRRVAVVAGRYGFGLVLHHHRGTDGHAAIEIGHVLIGHAEAAGGNRLSDRLRLVGAVNAIERRTEIERTGAKRIVDTALHMTRQIGTPRQHLG